jgi:hypothetical protein
MIVQPNNTRLFVKSGNYEAPSYVIAFSQIQELLSEVPYHI